jgi:hypothetical protein
MRPGIEGTVRWSEVVGVGTHRPVIVLIRWDAGDADGMPCQLSARFDAIKRASLFVERVTAARPPGDTSG